MAEESAAVAFVPSNQDSSQHGSQDLESLSDDELITMYREGEERDREAAITVIWRRYWKLAVWVCGGILGWSEAEAGAQECLLHAIDKLDKYHRTGRFRGWLGTVLRNKAKDLYREGKFQVVDEESEKKIWVPHETSMDQLKEKSGDRFDGPSSESLPEPELLAQEREEEIRHLVQEVLASITNEDRRIAVLMFFFEGKKYQQIAEETGAEEGTVKSRIARGKATMLRYVEENGLEDRLRELLGL